MTMGGGVWFHACEFFFAGQNVTGTWAKISLTWPRLHSRLLIGYDLWLTGKVQRATLWASRVPDRAATDAEFSRANRPLAEFRHVGAESRLFFSTEWKGAIARFGAIPVS